MPETAESDYRQAITIIEGTRAQLQLSALRAEFFADKRDVYDALLKLLFAKAGVAGAFSVLERSRARTFQDRLSGSAQTVSPMISEYKNGWMVQPSFSNSGVSMTIGLIWCTRSEYGILQQQLSQTDMANVRGFSRIFLIT